METVVKTIKTMAWVAALWLPAAAFAQQTEVNPRAAAMLASNCANCHGTSGNALDTMPSLAGLQKAYIVEQMRAFRDGKRTATIMNQLAKGYTDQQVELIADFFSRQKPAR